MLYRSSAFFMNKTNRTPVTRPVVFTRHYYTPDELETKSLSDCTVSSTVAYGPDDVIEGMYRFLLESINEACLANQPDTVKRLTDIIGSVGAAMVIDSATFFFDANYSQLKAL